ncbi:hypothetical protein ASB57_28855 [Bordetella sp. N]|nr:hypothetical protein ASB57_28855 [Bordetella sp. N]
MARCLSAQPGGPGKRQNAHLEETALTIERLFTAVKHLSSLKPALDNGDTGAVTVLFEKEAYRCVDALTPDAFERIYQGPLSLAEPRNDSSYRQALLMRLHSRPDLPAQTALTVLEQALQGRHVDQIHVKWLRGAERVLVDRAARALELRTACQTPEQDRNKLEHALYGAFLDVSQQTPATLEPVTGACLALARLPAPVWPLYQRALPFAIVNETRQTLRCLHVPASFAIAESAWRRYCQTWEQEYARRVVTLDRVIADLSKAGDLPDTQAGERMRATALGLSRLAALIRVGLRGVARTTSLGHDTPDVAWHGEIAERYAGITAALRVAQKSLGLSLDAAHAGLAALSDKELAAVVTAVAALHPFGLRVDQDTIAAERDRRLGLLAQAKLKPCLERLAGLSPAAGGGPVASSVDDDRPFGVMHEVAEIGPCLRDATDALQEVVTLFVACGGRLMGAEETTDFVHRIVDRVLPDLCIAPARARVLERLTIALGDAHGALAYDQPGHLHHGDAAALLSRADLLQSITDRLIGLDDAPDLIDGAFFHLIRRVASAATLGAFVSSAPVRPDDADGGDPQGREARLDADVLKVLQNDFGVEAVVHAYGEGDASQTMVVQDPMARQVHGADGAPAVMVREIYKEELAFKILPVRKSSAPPVTGAPGSYGVSPLVVDHYYALDYERGSCSLSVRGRTPTGEHVSFDPVAAPYTRGGGNIEREALKRARVENAVAALEQLKRIVDASGFRQLTQFLSQMAASPICRAEARSIASTPVRLVSGEPVSVGGAAHIHTLIEQNLDGTFDMTYHVEWVSINTAQLVDPQPHQSDVIELDPAHSRKAVRFAWRLVTGEDPVIRPLQLADYRYRFVPSALSRRSSFAAENE